MRPLLGPTLRRHGARQKVPPSSKQPWVTTYERDRHVVRIYTIHGTADDVLAVFEEDFSTSALRLNSVRDFRMALVSFGGGGERRWTRLFCLSVRFVC